MPFEELMGPKIADSQFCLEILARKFHKDCSSRLSSEDQAMASYLMHLKRKKENGKRSGKKFILKNCLFNHQNVRMFRLLFLLFDKSLND